MFYACQGNLPWISVAKHGTALACHCVPRVPLKTFEDPPPKAIYYCSRVQDVRPKDYSPLLLKLSYIMLQLFILKQADTC